MFRIQKPDRPEQSDIAQAIRFRRITINDCAIDRAVGSGEGTGIYQHAPYPPRVANRLGTGRELEWDGKDGADSFGHSIAHRNIDELNVVDDLAAFLLAIDLFFVADEMPVGILPTVTHRGG